MTCKARCLDLHVFINELNLSSLSLIHVARSDVRGKVIYKGDPSRSEGGKVIKPIMKWMAPFLSNPQVRYFR